MPFRTLLLLFLLFRAIDFIVLYFAPNFIPYLGFFPYGETLKDYRLPHFLSSLAYFDGVHYLLIAKNGYSQYEQAFFPLYPILIRYLTPVFFNNHLLTGLIISNLFFFLGLLVFLKYVKGLFPDAKNQNSISLWSAIFLIAFPTSFFFGALYTEGLFFFLVVTFLFWFRRKRYLHASLFGFLASVTRLIGLFLLIPPLIEPVQLRKLPNIKKKLSSIRLLFITHYRLLIALLSPLIGLLTYSLYLLKTTGDPFYFFTSQPIFGAHRSTNIILLPQVFYRYIKIFFTATWNFQYFISLFEFFIFIAVFTVLVYDLFTILRNPHPQKGTQHFALSVFSLANLLIPTFTGTLSSIPRYALLSLSFFITLARIPQRTIKVFIAILFLILHIVLLGFFSQGYFVS